MSISVFDYIAPNIRQAIAFDVLDTLIATGDVDWPGAIKRNIK